MMERVYRLLVLGGVGLVSAACGARTGLGNEGMVDASFDAGDDDALDTGFPMELPDVSSMDRVFPDTSPPVVDSSSRDAPDDALDTGFPIER